MDNHPLFRDALRSTIRIGLPHARIDEADSIDAAKAVLAERPGIDVIVLDLSMKAGAKKVRQRSSRQNSICGSTEPVHFRRHRGRAPLDHGM